MEIVLGKWGLELPSGEQSVMLNIYIYTYIYIYIYISECVKDGHHFSDTAPIER